MPETNVAGAETVAENIRSNVEKLVIPNEKSLPAKIVTISLGVAGVDDSTQVLSEELIKYADLSLYEAKEKGRNRIESYRDVPGK